MPIHTHFFRRAILTHKVDQIYLVFSVQSGLSSTCVHARLQICVQWLSFVQP